ncbi:DoxX family membrane protein [Nonomuraea wenchangensis]|uniref:DoxX family protein n=1 Tax=Nonomuraea wenchangensis TaxID=568860 RepID=UPI0034481764
MKRVVFDVAVLITRVVTGVIFVAHGWQKWQAGLGATTGAFSGMGIPLPGAAAGFAAVVETVGGVLLILGLLVRPVALLLLIDMLGAIIFVHGGRGVMVGEGGWELAGALGALSLLFLALGGGRIGLDGLLGAIFRRREGRRAAEDELIEHRRGPAMGPGPSNVRTTGVRPGGAEGAYPAGTGVQGGPEAGAGMPSGPEAGAGGGRAAEPMTPAEPGTPAERPEASRRPSTPRVHAGGLDDEDMRDIDALISEDQPEHRKPPNR